jgi:hypothetical protein
MDFVTKLNTRQLQAYAALCVWKFCSKFGIKHVAICELINHLMSILTAHSLSDWEQDGSALTITGRGDLLPSDVIKLVKLQDLGDFDFLVQCCIEVGLADMYGASSDQPRQFMEKCMDILRDFDVELPSFEVLSKYRKGTSAWGDAISEDELKEILRAYEVELH